MKHLGGSFYDCSLICRRGAFFLVGWLLRKKVLRHFLALGEKDCSYCPNFASIVSILKRCTIYQPPSVSLKRTVKKEGKAFPCCAYLSKATAVRPSLKRDHRMIGGAGSWHSDSMKVVHLMSLTIILLPMPFGLPK